MTHELSADSGVNLGAGNIVSASAATIQAKTRDNSPFLALNDRSAGHFRGLRTLSFTSLPSDVEFHLTTDGNGTKTAFNVLAGTPEDAGRDLLAMTAGDSTRKGGLPLGLVNQLDVSTLKTEAARRFVAFLMEGLNDALNELNMIGLGGETAEMNEFVGSEITGTPINFNWSGTVLSAFHPDRMITGAHIKAGHIVIALKEKEGFRCNGGSTVRRAFRLKFGRRWKLFHRKWWLHPEAQSWLPLAAAPSTLYDALLVDTNGWLAGTKRIPVSGIAHITGGGIPEKLGNLLAPLGLSANLTSLFVPTRIMRISARWLREAGVRITDEELYRVFNGGQGALVVLDEKYADDFLFRASTLGIDARAAGRIVEASGEPRIRIASRYGGGVKFDVPVK